MIKSRQIFSLSQELLYQEIEGETVILDMKSEKYFGLNDVGSSVMKILKTGVDFEHLLVSMLDIYNVEEDILKDDITNLLQELLDAGLIQTKN